MMMAILLLVPSSIALADEGHSHSKNLSDDIQSFKDGEESEDSPDDHNMSPDEHNNMTETESSDHVESNAEGRHGHGTEVYVETPPNFTVLSIFGAINLSFLVIGLWNKRIRKKVEIDGNA
jgi:hypothetical protein